MYRYYSKNKYKNKKTIVDGIKFDSKKEATRYMELKLLEKAGEIKDLKLQPKFLLIPAQEGEKSASYKADFSYTDLKTGKKIVEDVKGFKTDTYVIKRKLFKCKYPEYTFREI